MATTKKKTSAKTVSSKKRGVSQRTYVILLGIATVIIAVLCYALYSAQQDKQASAVGAATCGTGYYQADSAPVRVNGAFNGATGPAKLVVYKHNSSTRKRCYLLIATGSAYGVVKRMRVDVYDKTNPTAPRLIDTDTGEYRYYAGPIYSNNISYTFTNAFMYYNGVNYSTGIHVKY